MSKNQSGQFIGGLLLGTAVGVVTGILMAPRSGQQTRKILKKSVAALPDLAEDISTSVQFQADRLGASTKDTWEDTLSRVREAIAAGVEASLREQENPSMASRPLHSEEQSVDPDTDQSFTEEFNSSEGSTYNNSLDLQ
ncbi:MULTISPECIES: YtxH domain-containing protein [unclassified Roseofilum]|uniref:YtxH domain-containing protein n=1 Tax=unclassified Roseofilum TaxID=2620099 RepID=UPI000E9C14A0|nr:MULTISPECIES: YtxH domain-containing protein [unclassified Roseofilum]MBP0009440.1 YtxH domain-containing protein [Roseofilum sp. Belize Diploria]MBP0034940.1 YtxH domain-containing protein [Roseofilum sp. Belize BBD 4]HBR00542.1 gas vesicle protein [Cyanobacteria bacterium UBA11691]